MYVAQVDLHRRDGDGLHRISQRHGGVAVAAGIEDDPCARRLGVVKGVDQLTLNVPFKALHFDIQLRGSGLNRAFKLGKRHRAIHRRVTLPQQVQIGAVQEEDALAH